MLLPLLFLIASIHRVDFTYASSNDRVKLRDGRGESPTIPMSRRRRISASLSTESGPPGPQ